MKHTKKLKVVKDVPWKPQTFKMNITPEMAEEIKQQNILWTKITDKMMESWKNDKIWGSN